MSFSAKRCAYCPRPSFSSQSATLAYADVPISTRVNKSKKSLQRLRWFDFHRHLIRQATKRQSKRGNALGLVSRDSFYSVPAGRRLVGGSLQPRSDAGERSPSHLGCWFDAVEEVRSGPSQATRHVAVAGILKILQPLPARDVSKKMFPPATLLKTVPLRIVREGNPKPEARSRRDRIQIQDRAACVFHPKGPGQLRAPEPYQIKAFAREGGW
jgi:hypothetical protein